MGVKSRGFIVAKKKLRGAHVARADQSLQSGPGVTRQRLELVLGLRLGLGQGLGPRLGLGFCP